MLFHSLLRTLRTVLIGHGIESKPARARRQPATRCRPCVEVLEDRLAPAIFTITASTNPDPVAASIENGSELNNKINDANNTPGADEIDLPTGTFLSLGYGNNQFSFETISNDLTFKGAGQDKTFISGNNQQYLAFDVYNSNVAISDLTIAGCAGGVRNEGDAAHTLTITKVTLSANFAHIGGADMGGGIYNAGGTVTISDSTLLGNSAISNGGGIYNLGGTVDMNGGSLSGNTADQGGGIFANGGTVHLTGVVLSDNTAISNGGAIYSDPSVVVITSCTFTGNTAPAGADLFNLDSSVTLVSTSLNGVANNGGGTITLIGSRISGSGGGTVTDPVANLLTEVAALNLSSGQTNNLISTLQAAQKSLMNAKRTAAVNQLNAFINQLNALVNSHRLGEITADSMINEVDNLVDLIG